ncbi:brassinosteroid-responsive RING protein 1-like [Cornus florida]|uniref:brassinosteroid-responsive RING protein 1-like n=1 Tax=Cornus florida TaxID=4283 RepID=UPI0028968923|nr:brassinosteroid-responsive RING protein 1-like [Cornus florida]
MFLWESEPFNNIALMGSTCFSIRATKLMPIALFNALLVLDLLGHLLKDIVLMVLSCIPLLNRASSDKHTINDSAAEYRPSPLLVPVPVHCMTGAIKDRVPVLDYSCVLERLGGCKVNPLCVVCLKRMKVGDEVRELYNCCHVFHRECVDTWIDEGQVTCPLCRAKLLPNQGEDEMKYGGDPWRRERMIYLKAK